VTTTPKVIGVGYSRTDGSLFVSVEDSRVPPAEITPAALATLIRYAIIGGTAGQVAYQLERQIADPHLHGTTYQRDTALAVAAALTAT
jgi:hypothetical protein